MSAMVKVHLDGGLRAAMIRLRMPVQVDTQDGGSFSGIMVPSGKHRSNRRCHENDLT